MSPLSAPVLGGAALAASPALWAGLVSGELPLDVALTRYLVAIGICWALLSLIAEFALPRPGTVKIEQQVRRAAPPGSQPKVAAQKPEQKPAPETGPETGQAQD